MKKDPGQSRLLTRAKNAVRETLGNKGAPVHEIISESIDRLPEE
jgi:hypothetical protein